MADETFRVFSGKLNKLVLVPTFQRARDVVMNAEANLSDRADALYSIVWLRQGHVVEYRNDLKGFERIWSNIGPAETQEARGLLVRQFEYLINNGPRQTNLLRDFDLEGAAKAIADAAKQAGSASALATYLDFQGECSEASTPNEYRSCNRQLTAALKFGESEVNRLNSNLGLLRSDLAELKESEAGAAPALAALQFRLDVVGNSCSQLFEKEVVPTLRNYYLNDQKELIAACHEEFNRHGIGGGIAKVIEAQESDEERTNLRKAVGDRMATVNQAEACRSIFERRGELRAEPALQLAPRYRRVECIRQPNEDPVQIARKKKKTKGSGSGSGVLEGGTVAVAKDVTPDTKGGSGTAGKALAYFTRGRVPNLDLQDWQATKDTLAARIDYAKSLDGAEKSREEQKIRNEIQSFARQYENAWKNYLSSIQLKPEGGSAPGAWLSTLSKSGAEWRTVLEPAADALAVDPQPADPVLGVFDRGLAGLSSVRGFLDGDLGEYLAQLDGVGADVTHCANDPSFASKYRAAYRDSDPNNSLVKAERWIVQRGGQSLAEGSLAPLLSKPLTVAKGALGASDEPSTQWDLLVSASRQLAGKFPFGGADATALVGGDELRLLLGGKSGYVTTVWGMQDSLQLGPAARAWLTRAHDLSLAFYEAGSDEPRPYPLQIALDPASMQILPDKVRQDGKWRVEAVKFETGGDEFDWVADKEKPTKKKLALELIGDPASGTSKLVVTPASLDTGLVGIGKNKWKPQPPTVAASADGFWAPLQAIASLDRTKLDEGRVAFQVAAKFPYKKEGGTASVKLVAQGPKLAALLDIFSNPLPPAPASGS
jgi:hypothetical protein